MKKVNAPPSIEEESDRDNLPEGWAITTLDDAGQWLTGGTPSRSISQYFRGSIPWVKSGDLNDGVVTSVEERITRTALQNSAAKLLPRGTVSIALYGATIGKLGLLDIEAATNQACANCIVDSIHVDRWYLFYYLLSERQGLIDAGQGGAQPNLTNRIVRDWPFPLAPLAEQHRLVAKVRNLLEEVQKSQGHLAKIPKILKAFRQSVLAAACSGRLTEDWRETHLSIEPADVEMERVKSATEITKVRRGVPENVPVSAVVAAWRLPETWGCYSAAELLRIGAFQDVKDGNHGANHPKVSDFTEKGLPFITAAQVNNFCIDYAGAYKLSGAPLERIRVGVAKSGDVIYTHKGSVGRVAICDRNCVLTPQTTYYRVSPRIFINSFLMYYLASNAFSDQVDAVKEQTTRDFVPISEQYLLFHRVPPLSEQYEIVRRVDALFKLATRIEGRVAAATKRSDKLTQAVLAKAFKGELVPTEAQLARKEKRAYEPASALLARIEADGEVASNASVVRKKQKISACKQ